MAWIYLNETTVQKCWGGFLNHGNLTGTRLKTSLPIQHIPRRHQGTEVKSLN